MGKRVMRAKVVYVGKDVVFVRRADGVLVRVKAKRMSWAQRLFTARVMGRD